VVSVNLSLEYVLSSLDVYASIVVILGFYGRV